jgi:hypothetical protein
MVEEQVRTGRRNSWAFALVVVGSVIALLATVGSWVNRQLLDTDTWVDATDQLLADPEVRGALATYLVDELYESVEVGEEISDLLPTDFDALGPVLAAALREPATEAVDRLLASDPVRNAWREANRAAHSLLVAVIEDDTGDVLSTAGGVVSIDLGELVRALGERIGLGDRVLELIPEDAGVIVLFESDELSLVQDAAWVADRLAIALLVLVVAAFAAAIYLSNDRRRAVRDCGIGLVAVGVVAMLARIAGVATLADNLARADGDEPARSVLDIGTTLLRQIALTEILVGLVLIAFAALVGPSSPARRIRGLLAPAFAHGTLFSVVGGLAVYLLFLWVKPGGPISGGWIALGLAVLCVAGVGWVLRTARSEALEPALAQGAGG